MGEYDETGYYEIQLNNKQLVFFFMAGLAIAVVIFLCGVMVGRGVRDATITAAESSLFADGGLGRPAERGTSSAEVRRELDYTQRLESPAVESRLERSTSPETLVAGRETMRVETPRVPAADSASAGEPAAKSAPPSPSPSAPPAENATRAGGYTIQVVALKTRDAAQSVVSRLENRGYPAYLDPGADGGLFRVRVGTFESRAEAERVASDLRQQEKFKPYITTQ